MKQATVVIIDEDSFLRESLSDDLKNEFSTILKASDEKETLSLMKTHSFDVILVDINLPGKSGIELIRMIKMDFPDVISFAITDDVHIAIAQQALNQDINGYIVKPLNMKGLIHKIIKEMETYELRKSLKNNEKKLKSLFAYAPGAYYILDFSGNFINANMAAEKLLDFKKDELIGKNLFRENILSSPYMKKAARILAHNEKNEQVGPEEIGLIRKDGSRLTVEISTCPVTLDNIRLVLVNARDVSERKKLEKKTKEYASILKSTIEALDKGILVSDKQGMITFSNNHLFQFWDLPEDFFHENNLKEFVQHISQKLYYSDGFLKKANLSHTKLDAYECELLNLADGRILEWYSRPQKKKKDIIGRVWVFKDITRQKTQETELSLFKTAMDFSNDSVFLIDFINQKIIETNRELERKTGYSREELLNLLPETLCGKKGNDSYLELADSILKNENGIVREMEITGKDGKCFPAEISARSIGSNREPLLIIIARDISQRKKSERRLRLLMESVSTASDSIMITDSDANIEYVNKTFEDVTGYTSEEVYRKNTRNIMKSGKLSKEFYRNMWEELRTNGYWEGVMLNKRKNGEIYHDKTRIISSTNNGQAEHYIAIKNDITSKVAIEKELTDIKEEHERFLRHELANILGPIKGYTELFNIKTRGNLDDSSKALLDKIVKASDSAIHLVDKLKQVQEMEKEGFSCDIRYGSLQSMLAGVLSDFWNNPLYEKVKINFSNDTVASGVGMDYDLLPGVFVNLIKNAIEHVENLPDPEERQVNIRMYSDRNDFINVMINNGGPPLPPAFLSTFFNKFNTQRQKKGGTGLGTTFAYLVTKAHGGDITVDSNQEEGTTVTVALKSR